MFDLTKFLADDLGMTAEQIGLVAPTLTPFAPKFATRFDGLDTQRADLTTQKQALDQANARLNEEVAQWAATRAADEPITVKMKADLAKAQGDVARLTAVVTTVATQAGIDPATVLGTTPPVVPASPATPTAPDLTGYVRTEDLAARLNGLSEYLLVLPAELLAISQEHQTLTGQPLDARAIVAEVKTRATANARERDASRHKPIDARLIWEEQHQIAAKRTAAAVAAHTAEITAAEERGVQRARTEQATPTPGVPGQHAPIFQRPAGFTPKLQRPGSGPTSAVSAAASALATHRYRKSGTTAAA